MTTKALPPICLGVALALSAWSASYAFDGQKPSAPPSASAGGARSQSMMAPPASAAQRTQNAPNANAIQTGGIQANQLAADQSALDKLLYAAIESSNPEEVRNALKAGINLRQDYSYTCGYANGFRENYPAEEKFNNLASPDALRGDASSVPGHCTKQHFQHAFKVANEMFVHGLSKSTEARGLAQTHLDPEQIVELRFSGGGSMRDNVLAEIKAGRSHMDAAFEVLALIDANMPTADKAFYPAYMVNYMAGAATLRDPFLSQWIMSRYYEALPEIKRARTLREPKHVAWDAYKAARMVTADNHIGQTGMRYELALFDPKAIAGGDESATVKAFSVIALDVEAIHTSMPGLTGYFCGDSKNPADELAKTYLSHDVDAYTADGLAARPFSKFMAQLRALPSDPRSSRRLDMAKAAVNFYGFHSLVSSMLSKPDVIDALNNKMTAPAGGLPPLNLIAMKNLVDPALLRAMLNAGVSPSLRAKDGKTAADVVIGTSAFSLWQAQAFTKKDLNDPGCPPLYSPRN